MNGAYRYVFVSALIGCESVQSCLLPGAVVTRKASLAAGTATSSKNFK